jgi:type IV fimbrial biogenesis protein FimT
MHRSLKGFTLIELLITMSVIAIVASLSATSFIGLVEKMTASATRSNIERTFSLGRFTAVTEQTIVTICPLDNANRCSSDYSRPTAIFRDPANSLELSDTSQLVKSVTLAAGGTLIPSNTPHGPRTNFQYRPDGSIRGTLGNFTWCPASGDAKSALHVRINFGGRLIWSRDTNGNQVVETSQGEDVSC